MIESSTPVDPPVDTRWTSRIPCGGTSLSFGDLGMTRRYTHRLSTPTISRLSRRDAPLSPVSTPPMTETELMQYSLSFFRAVDQQGVDT